MARDVLQTVALVDDTDGICASQSPGAGAISINGALASGGVAYIYSSTGSPGTRMAQEVALTSGGNDSGITFTIVGTDADGYAQTETVTGANASVAVSTKYFSTVSSITQSGAVAGTLIVGVRRSDGGVTRTLRANHRAINFNIGMGLDVTGTITCTVQHTFDDIQDSTATKTWFNHATLASKTADTDGNYAFQISGIRLLVVPTSTATAKLTVMQ
jgi:hypothetical protein